MSECAHCWGSHVGHDPCAERRIEDLKDQLRAASRFAIGDTEWPGVSKVLEEMGELQQVLGKIMGVRGMTDHWSGDLRKMLIEETADLLAALTFLQNHCLTDAEARAIRDRMMFKLERFEAWHRNEYCFGCGAMVKPHDPCVCK